MSETDKAFLKWCVAMIILVVAIIVVDLLL